MKPKIVIIFEIKYFHVICYCDTASHKRCGIYAILVYAFVGAFFHIKSPQSTILHNIFYLTLLAMCGVVIEINDKFLMQHHQHELHSWSTTVRCTTIQPSAQLSPPHSKGAREYKKLIFLYWFHSFLFSSFVISFESTIYLSLTMFLSGDYVL